MGKNKTHINSAETNRTYNVDAKGSLGLLALGDIGLRAWRKFRDSNKKDEVNE